MELNTAIWGDSSHQILQSNAYSDHITVSDIIPDIYTYYDTYGMSEPIDNSIALWQIGDNSWFNKLTWLRRDNNNVIQKSETTTVNAKSLWLCVPVTYNTSHNIHFNPTQYQCNLWDSDSTSTYYNQPTSNLRGIVTGFDYNRLMLRTSVSIRLFDSDTKIHSGNSTRISIYEYFNGVDGNNRPYKDYYAIESLLLYVASGNSSYQFTQNCYLTTPKSIQYAGRLYTNTLYNSPSTTDGYYKPTFLFYAQNYEIFGLTRTPKNNIPQQAVFGSNTSFYFNFDDTSWVLDEFRDSNTDYIAARYTGTYEELLKQISYLGFWFNEDDDNSNTITNVLGGDCTDNHVILPEIINGRTTGNYKRGTAAGADPQATWGNNWRDNVNYTGDVPYDQESEKTEFPSYVISVPAFGKTYVFDYTNISVLGERLKNFGQTEYDPKVFYNQNPIECIGFIKVFPFSNFQMRACLDGSVTSRTNSIFIGLWDSEVPAGYTQIKSTDMSTPIWEGEDTIRPKWGDFRDFEPYSKYSLYLPFCGTIEIPATIILNNKITVKYSLDVLSGQVTAYVLINDILYCTASGNCALEVPIDGYRVADYKTDMLNLETSKIIAKTNFGNDIAMSLRGSGNALMTEGINRKHIANPLVTTGGVSTALGSAVQAFSSTMQNLATYKKYSQLVDYTAPAPAFISSGSGLGAWCNPLNVQVIIQRPKMLQFNEEIYAKTTGYACCIYDKLNSQQEEGKDNFVQVNDIILDDIPLTENEKTNLLSLLQSGVII